MSEQPSETGEAHTEAEAGEIQGLSGETRVEGVAVGDAVDPGPEETTIEPLRASTTRQEEVDVDDTPLVLMDEGDQLDTDSEELTIPALVGEIKRLRSQVQIVRTERTAAAGRKYALEVVIESLREKVEQAAALLDEIEDPPEELAEVIKSLQLVLGDARRIADTKAVLEKDLEEERRRHLEERQAYEQRGFELEQAVQGLRSERDALRGTVAKVEGERLEWMEKLADVQDQLSDKDLKLSEVESQASEQMQSYQERVEALEAELESKTAAAGGEKAELEHRLEEALAESQGATQRLAALDLELEEAREAGTEVETLRKRVEELEQERFQRKLDAAAERTEAEEKLIRLRSELETELGEARAELESRARDAEARAEQAEEAAAEVGVLEAAREEGEARQKVLEAERDEALARADLAEVERAEVKRELNQAKHDLEASQAETEKAREELTASQTRMAASTTRLQALEERAESESAELGELKARIKALESQLGQKDATLGEQRKALIEVKPMLEDWTRLDKENQRLSRLVGEARKRGTVNVQELMARAALLRRLEKLTEE